MVLGQRIDLRTTAEVDRALRERARGGAGLLHIATLNPEYVMRARRDAAFAEALARADLALIDGIGIAIAARVLQPGVRAERFTGVALTERIGELSAETDARLFLLGAGPGVAERAAAAMRHRIPSARIIGVWADGSPRPEDDAESIRRIAGSGANVVLVAYGAPGQVVWIERNRQVLEDAGVRIAIGVGGALDYIAGITPYAPKLVRRVGLEWAYRLLREPWRWRRQLVLPVFALLVVRDAVRRRAGRVN